MEEIIQRVQKSVQAYQPKTHIKSMRVVLDAVRDCLKYIDENSKDDRGCCQRLARELDQIFWGSTHFRKYSGEKEDIISRHTTKLAREHLDDVERELKKIVAAEDEQKKAAKLDWVKTHPIFQPLQQKTSKAVPKNAYVLLFRRLSDGELELVTKKVPNMLITRFRPREFKESLHVYNSFHNKSIVGAAIISDRNLIATIGELPPPKKNKDQLATLLSISSEAAAKPSKQYIEQNSVLNELHQMTERREIPKEAYILLFTTQAPESKSVESGTAPDASDRQSEKPAVQSHSESRLIESDTNSAQEADGDDSNTDDEAAETNDLEADEVNSAVSDEANLVDRSDAMSSVEKSDEANSADEADEVNAVDQADEVNAVEQADEVIAVEQADEVNAVDKAGAGKSPQTSLIVTRAKEQDRITTRFWSPDFINARKIIHELGGKIEITGATIIHKNKLFKVFGTVPQAVEGRTQLQVILDLSNSAVDRPAVDFVEAHDVFKPLHSLANGTFSHSNSYVLVFEQLEDGKLEVVRPDGKNARLELIDFRTPRKIHDRFSKRGNIVGASVIAEVQTPTPTRREPVAKGSSSNSGGFGGAGSSRGPSRRDQAPASKPSVVAAFGKTPLKLNLLATPEILERFGLRI